MATLGIDFCQLQQKKHIEKQNEIILEEKMFKELYTEIDNILPASEYCLEPKKEMMNNGEAALRVGAERYPRSRRKVLTSTRLPCMNG